MSVAMSRAGGVTVFTVTSDPQSPWPPLCQVLRSLCCNPACYSSSKQLHSIQRSSASVLGAVQVVVGLLHIGLGAVLTATGSWWLSHTGFPYWTGVLCVVFGIVCILFETIQSPCLVIMNVILNLAGAAFAVSAIVVYSINITDIYVGNPCREDYYYREDGTTPSPDPVQTTCLEAQRLTLAILRSINSVLIISSVLELCVTISAAVLSIRALCGIQIKPNQSSDLYKPLLEEISSEP